MYILFALIISSAGGVSFTQTEFVSQSACNAAKATAEYQVPTGQNYVNRATYFCVAK